MNLSPRELVTLSAALLFWSEEMLPHGRRIMRPYFRRFRRVRLTPLHRREIDRLSARLQAQLSSRR